MSDHFSARMQRAGTRVATVVATLLFAYALTACSDASGAATSVATGRLTAKPTVVLVHGAFADASSYSEVSRRLQNDGYLVLAPANPLRGVGSDTAYLRSILDAIAGPVVLVGHSYGGALIGDAAAGDSRVKALVFVAAFLADVGEPLSKTSRIVPSVRTPSGRWPGGRTATPSRLTAHTSSWSPNPTSSPG